MATRCDAARPAPPRSAPRLFDPAVSGKPRPQTDAMAQMNEELLISLVKDRRELYDTEHKQYEDNYRREAAWGEIAQIMQQPPHECRDRWKRLRDNYRRARKLRQIKKAQGVTKLKTIKHEKVIGFLDKIMEINNDPTETSQDDEESAGSSMIDSKHDEDAVVDPLTNDATYASYEEAPSSVNYKPDTVVTFFTNLGETVKSFPEEIQIRVKRDIFKIINDAEEEVYKRKRKRMPNISVENVTMKYELSEY